MTSAALVALCLLVSAPSPAAVSVEDDQNRLVTLPNPARRIVSLAPHVTEMLFAAGAGDRLVGVVSFSDFPPEAARLPAVGTYTEFDLEAIVALNPDLVVAWASGNPMAQVERLRDLGITVFFSEPRDLRDIGRDIERLGILAGTSETAGAAARAYRLRLAELSARYGGRPPISVFYQVWEHPLVTLNGRHLISRVIELCGGRNVFTELPTLAPVVDIEAVLTADPDVIIASGMGYEQPEWLGDWRHWTDLTAVAHDNLFAIPSAVIQRSGPRLLQGAEILCRHLETARERSNRL